MEEAGSLALTPTEELIAGVWSSLLEKSDIRRDDNFFHLGGHSLMVIQMVSRLRQVFNREIDLRAMFESLILKDLAAYVDQLTGSTQQTAAIPRVDRKGKLALSYGQERLWFIYQLEPENVAYNVPGAVRIQGPLDVESLERTLQEIVRRHESLRTRFVSVIGEPQQIIDASVAVEVPVTELSHLAEPEREAEARRLALEDARQPFDLARGPLFRVKLLRLASQDHVLVFNMHHIVSDMWSVGVLVREVSAIYNNFSTGQPSPLPELDIQYADFSAWQREFLSGSLLEKQLEYWKQKLAAVEPLMLPTDRPRTALQRPEGATTHFTVPVELTEALKTLSRKQGATLYMILLAAFQALLSRYSGQSDITVGSPIAGRSRTETEGLIGVFINTLVLRSDLSGQPVSIELLQRVKATTLEAFANQDVPFEKLVEVLLPQRDLTRSPLFQVLFVLQNVPWTVLQLGAAKMLAFDVDSAAAQFEMSLVLAETDSGMEGSIVYNKGLFDAESVTRMIGHYQMLLNGMVAEPSQSIALLPLMSVQEKKQVIEEWNETKAEFPSGKCVHELFEEQVARTPQAVAVIYEEEQLSYEELNARANRLAWYLRERGVGPDVLVGVFLERSLEMLVGLLGILKAGGCYLPLDPSFPAERLRYMVEDARPALLLTQEQLEQRIVDAGAQQTLCLDRDWETVGKRPETNLQPVGSGENLTYVIYTSGSTGRPKGVMVTRQALMNFLQSMMSIPGMEQSDVLAAVTTVSFDIAGLELYLPLITGGRILFLSRDIARDAHELHQMLIEHSVTVMQATPSTWSMLLLDGWRPRSAFKILCGGEALNRDLATKLVGHDVPVWNLYGPTETTVWSCLKQLKSSEAVTIGKPIANTQVYVVDEEMEPVPVGVSGELYIGGIGLARGYLNRPELTAERFVPDPFVEESGARMYRTGDLVRWQVDGNLEYLGRLDQQVKIRGFRIELEEIEAILETHPSVARCVVLAREDQPGEKRLVAYVVKKADAPWPNASGLEEYLKVSLPEYMVPTVFVELEKLPLNHNGKIDRKALPQPDRDTPEEEYVGPRDPTEETLCRLWQEVLRRDRVGIHDNFFNIGGHSLLAVQVISRIKSAFAMEMPLDAIFAAPTVARMAEYIVVALREGKLVATPTVMTVQSMLAEAVLDPVIAPNSGAVQQFPTVPGSNLLLTGANGFLGAFLLAEIMQQMPAARVHCLVRAATAQEGMRRVRERLSGFALWREEFSDRIVPLPGDLAKPSLGLSSDDFHRLANEIDTIYHNGALVNFFYAYSMLKSANVDGTSEILRLATLGSLKPVHYVSSMVVFPSVGGQGPELVDEETSLDAIAGLMGGYGQSKWVAERLVRIARERGIPVTIYRPGMIAAHSRTGLGSHDDLLSRILQCSLQLGAAPDFDLELDLAPVDYVSGALVWLSRQPGSIGKTFHLLNPRTVTCSQILNWLFEAGMPVERLSLSDWFERLHRAAQNSANNAGLYSLQPLFGAGASRGLDNGEAVAPQPRYDCRRTVESLAGSGWVCPPSGPEQFRLTLSHLERGKEAEANGHERPRSSPVLVSIQPQGSRAPLFFVHPVGGQVISYAELSQELGLEQPFYGLQSPPTNFFPESDMSIEQMATLYNREIRSVQPVGPYLLSGWSMGGLVAWEMAQQLIKEGETINLLALIDTTPPSGYLEADDRDDEISMLARFALDMSRLVGMDPQPLAEQFSRAAAQDQWKMVQETLTSYGVLAPKTAHAEMTALLDVYARNFRAMNNYSLHPSDQSVVFFRASETPERFSKLWTKWSDGGIQFHSVPGDHFTILRRPNVHIIAEALVRRISANGSKEPQAVSPETVRYSF
jgi:amino acid adenylation domain-containing protein/thioester reductase-like protein